MEDLSNLDILILVRFGINLLIAYGIVIAGIRLNDNSNSPIAKPIMMMFICIAIEIVIVSIGLFVNEYVRQIIAIIGRIVEGAGVLWFMHKLK